jgi:hypothetical protein
VYKSQFRPVGTFDFVLLLLFSVSAYLFLLCRWDRNLHRVWGFQPGILLFLQLQVFCVFRERCQPEGGTGNRSGGRGANKFKSWGGNLSVIVVTQRFHAALHG